MIFEKLNDSEKIGSISFTVEPAMLIKTIYQKLLAKENQINCNQLTKNPTKNIMPCDFSKTYLI